MSRALGETLVARLNEVYPKYVRRVVPAYRNVRLTPEERREIEQRLEAFATRAVDDEHVIAQAAHQRVDSAAAVQTPGLPVVEIKPGGGQFLLSLRVD